ncbi:hypothetical protein BJ956_002544 [Arthrobacter psychrochitiniphilus]|nr:hypothetical protein [Arthrobacter psychrochitiniphilus]
MPNITRFAGIDLDSSRTCVFPLVLSVTPDS